MRRVNTSPDVINEALFKSILIMHQHYDFINDSLASDMEQTFKLNKKPYTELTIKPLHNKIHVFK